MNNSKFSNFNCFQATLLGFLKQKLVFLETETWKTNFWRWRELKYHWFFISLHAQWRAKAECPSVYFSGPASWGQCFEMDQEAEMKREWSLMQSDGYKWKESENLGFSSFFFFCYFANFQTRWFCLILKCELKVKAEDRGQRTEERGEERENQVRIECLNLKV